MFPEETQGYSQMHHLLLRFSVGRWLALATPVGRRLSNLGDGRERSRAGLDRRICGRFIEEKWVVFAFGVAGGVAGAISPLEGTGNVLLEQTPEFKGPRSFEGDYGLIIRPKRPRRLIVG